MTSEVMKRYSSYRNTDRLRGREFTLTRAEFTTLVKEPCSYCGGYNDSGINGLDRVDNTLGHILDNVVPCCGRCNSMKMNLTHIDFIGHVFKIFNHLNEYD